MNNCFIELEIQGAYKLKKRSSSSPVIGEGNVWKVGEATCSAICFYLFLTFFGCPEAYGVPRPGIRSEPQSWPKPQLQQGTEPTYQHSQEAANPSAPHWELLFPILYQNEEGPFTLKILWYLVIPQFIVTGSYHSYYADANFLSDLESFVYPLEIQQPDTFPSITHQLAIKTLLKNIF